MWFGSDSSPVPKSYAGWVFGQFSPCSKGFSPLQKLTIKIQIWLDTGPSWKAADGWCGFLSKYCNLVYLFNFVLFQSVKLLLHCTSSCNSAKFLLYGWLVCLFLFYLLTFSLQTGNKLLTVHEHTKQINDIQMYKDQTMFVTASKDHTAKVGV